MTFKHLLLIYVILIVCFRAFKNVDSAKILCIYPTPSQSHFIIADILLKELVNRGHEVCTL